MSNLNGVPVLLEYYGQLHLQYRARGRIALNMPYLLVERRAYVSAVYGSSTHNLPAV